MSFIPKNARRIRRAALRVENNLRMIQLGINNSRVILRRYKLLEIVILEERRDYCYKSQSGATPRLWKKETIIQHCVTHIHTYIENNEI